MPADNSVRVTAASASVQGNVTMFVAAPGDLLVVRGKCIPIASVQTTDRLTLAYPWPGATVDYTTEYAILKTSDYWQRSAPWLLAMLPQIEAINSALPLSADAYGTIESRSQYDNQITGFGFLATNQTPPRYYAKIGSGVSEWSRGIVLGIAAPTPVVSGQVGAASGTGAAVAVARALIARTGAASGTGSATAVGNTLGVGASIGTASGSGAAAAVGRSLAAATGAASGSGTALGILPTDPSHFTDETGTVLIDELGQPITMDVEGEPSPVAVTGTASGTGSAIAAAGVTGTTATLNPADKDASVVLSGGNLIATKSGSDGYSNARGTKSISAGQGYFEVTIAAKVLSLGAGIANASASLSNYLGGTGNSVGLFTNGDVGTNDSWSNVGAIAQGAIVGVWFRRAQGEVQFFVNGTLVATIATSITTGFPAVGVYRTGDAVTVNFGSAAFSHLPSGATAWQAA